MPPYHAASSFLVLTNLLLIATLPTIDASSSLRLHAKVQAKTISGRRSTQKNKQHAFTFMDSSGSFPGMGHCVEGVLQAHLQARESNIRIAELPSFMNEYCEEDIAAALGTTNLPTATNDDVWNAATRPDDAASLSATTNSDPLVVTRNHAVVRVSSHDQHNMNMVRTMCTRLRELYEPKCCKERKPCCSGEWRARFASRPDALRYCVLVREAVEGRFASAMRLANDEKQKLDDFTQLPSYRTAEFNTNNPDCAKGGKYEHDVRCGRLGDGSMLMTDGGRSLPSFALQAEKTQLLRTAQDTLREVQKEVDASRGRANDIRSLLGRTVRPSGVNMNLMFTSMQPMDTSDFAGSEEGATGATIELLERVVSASLYNVQDEVVTCGPTIQRLCTREVPCKYGLSKYGENQTHNEPDGTNNNELAKTAALLEIVSQEKGDQDDGDESSWIDHSTNVAIRLSSAKKASRVKKILSTDMYKRTLRAAFEHIMPQYNVTRCSIQHVTKTVGLPQKPPKWYVTQVRTKVERAEKEEKMMNDCEVLAKRLLILTKRKTNLDIDVALLSESGKPSSQEKDRVERLALEIRIVGLNLTSCRAEGRLLYLKSGAKANDVVTSEMLELQKILSEANMEIHSVVQHGRLRSSLGALSLKARRIGSQIEQETRVVKRARLEAQLAELNMMRAQINAQLDRDSIHTKRLTSLRVALKKDPNNQRLKHRLQATLTQDQKERDLLLNIAKTGDRCASCRTRVLSVMETAVQHGFEQTRLPDYMSSFCEVRLAITGPKYALRNEQDIEKVCDAFRTNLENDLKESISEQAKQERLDGLLLPADAVAQRKERIRHLAPTASGHNTTLHAYCMATSDCGIVTQNSVVSSKKASSTALQVQSQSQFHLQARDPQSRCDRCASNLMGNVNKWRAASEGEAEVVVRANFVQDFDFWCHERLEKKWTLRKDLINVTCAAAAILPPSDDSEPSPPDHEYLFNPTTWVELGNGDRRTHRDLVQLYHVCSSIGECHSSTTKTDGAAETTTATTKTEENDDTVILPTEEEQDRLNRLIEEAETLEREKKEAEEALKRAENMEYAAKEKESKAEETAERQRLAAERCQAQLSSATAFMNENSDVVDHTCLAATTAEKHMEHVGRQLKEHQEQFKTIVMSHNSADAECDQIHTTSIVEYGQKREKARNVLLQCARDVNAKLMIWNEREREHAKNPNYPVGADAEHPNMRTILAEQNKLKTLLTTCEEQEVLSSAEAKGQQEKMDVDCKGRIGSLKQAEERVRALELTTKKMHTASAKMYQSATRSCKKSRKEQTIRVTKVRTLQLQCISAESLEESTKKKSASASAAAAAIEVAKAVAETQEESLGGPERGSSSGATGATGAMSATGGSATGGMQEESSAAADTYGGCALDVMAYERHARIERGGSVWGKVSAWALSFCKAEAESAKSRAVLVGKDFNVDINTACSFASNIFMTFQSGSELETTLKFCKTLRQFTGTPSKGIEYDRRTQHLLPKAPLSLRPEYSTSNFFYGPGPIAKTRERSEMEWYGNNEETTRLRHFKYGNGNLDYLMAPQDADIDAQLNQPREMIKSIEASFLKKWQDQQRSRGIKFVASPKDVVNEPNRQLKVPIPQHRLVKNQVEDSGESEGEGEGVTGSAAGSSGPSGPKEVTASTGGEGQHR